MEKIMGKLAILEIMLFDKLSNKWRVTGEVADVFKLWVSMNFECTKQWVDFTQTEGCVELPYVATSSIQLNIFALSNPYLLFVSLTSLLILS